MASHHALRSLVSARALYACGLFAAGCDLVDSHNAIAGVALRDAFAAIEAESLDDSHGVENFGSGIGSLDDGDWVRYAAVDFGPDGADRFDVKIGVPAQYAGQQIEIRLDSVTGTAVGTLVVADTGSWMPTTVQSVSIELTAGVHDVFLKFVGASGVGNIDYLQFGAGNPPNDSPPSGSCQTLTSSGPVTASANGQVIQNLRITSTAGNAVTVNGHSNVTLKNLKIRHAGGRGIYFVNAPGLRIENVEIEYTAAPAAGANPSYDVNNIEGVNSSGVVITRAKLARGSTGIYLVNSNGSRLSFIEGHDFRGPFPRGQVVQWNSSDDGRLEDFSVESPLATSWTEDNVNAYDSVGITIERGLIDGNNSPSGCGVIGDRGAANMLVEDVDALRQGTGCFCAYNGGPPAVHDVTYNRVRCRDTHCTGVQGRAAPSSGGLVFAVAPDSYAIHMTSSHYYNHCSTSNVVWDASRVSPLQLTKLTAPFTPRAPIRLNQCWQ